jgi:phosphoserine phosphatase
MAQLNQFVAVNGASDSSPRRPALCVDLDGTLIKSDSLLDAIFTLFRRRPLTALLSSRFLLQGKGAFKAEIGRQLTLDPTTLPYNQPLLHHLRAEHAAGRDIYLATATNEVQAKAIADHLGVFRGVLASRRNLNLRGNEKLHTLERQFSGRGFDYIGNAAADIPVLARAKKSMLANPSPGLAARLRRHQIAIDCVFKDRSAWLGALLRVLRVRQWPKNLLVFAPILLAHLAFDHKKLLASVVAFCQFFIRGFSNLHLERSRRR